jgi:ABC-type phosphate/phosphonate transport system ATPase subunit
MTSNPVFKWKEYLQTKDYDMLLHFVEKSKNGEKNDKMVILVGSERTGKSTLLNEIKEYVGTDNCHETLEEASTKNLKKLVILDGEINDMRYKELMVLKKVVNNQNVIGATNNIDLVDYVFATNSTKIPMTHKF